MQNTIHFMQMSLLLQLFPLTKPFPTYTPTTLNHQPKERSRLQLLSALDSRLSSFVGICCEIFSKNWFFPIHY